jgi:hypothetical protein
MDRHSRLSIGIAVCHLELGESHRGTPLMIKPSSRGYKSAIEKGDVTPAGAMGAIAEEDDLDPEEDGAEA